MIEPSDLVPTDLEDDKLLDWIDGYLAEADRYDWQALLSAIRDLGYHVGYKHGKEDVENGVYGKREEFTTTE